MLLGNVYEKPNVLFSINRQQSLINIFNQIFINFENRMAIKFQVGTSHKAGFPMKVAHS